MPKYYSGRRRSTQVDDSASQLVRNVSTQIVDHARTVLDVAIDTTAVSTLVADHYRRRPFHNASERQAAVHESGHFVAFESTGIGAGVAELFPPRRGETEWSGRASWYAILPREARHALAAELKPQIISTLAGPFAEAMLAGGAASTSLPELVEARFMARHLAEMCRRDPGSVFWTEALTTIAMIERHVTDIEECADRLIEKRMIKRWRFKRDAKMIASWRRPVPAIPGHSRAFVALARVAIAVTDPFDALVAN